MELSHALAARQALRVDIPAGPAAALDATALKNQRIAALVLADSDWQEERVAGLPAPRSREELAYQPMFAERRPRGVGGGGEGEADAALADAARDSLGRQADRHAPRLEQIGRAAAPAR